MLAATYDPTSVAADAFSMDNMAQGTTKKYVTAAELTVLSNTSGTNTGDQTTVTGNAGTATKLATARTINGISFDGSANITIPTGSFTWAHMNADTTAVAGHGYMALGSTFTGTITLTLPTTASVGDTVRAICYANGTKFLKVGVPGASDQISFGTSSTTAGTSGYLQMNTVGDSVELVCLNTSSGNLWVVASSIGNITVA
jgi:hypothetical protein